MARKSPTLTLVLPRTRPRNPLALPALTRQAGPHGNTGKAARQQARQRTQQALAALLAGDMAELDIEG